MTVGGILLAGIMIHLDSTQDHDWLRELNWLYSGQASGARALLSTIAGSMITVAGVTFSMTLLSVSHATAQIGPRIISGFMDNKGNQITLGTFIATFAFCLLILRTIHSGVDAKDGIEKILPFVPQLSIIVAMLLALSSIAVLIYFINHVPRTISMTSAVNRVGTDFLEQIHNLFSENIGYKAHIMEAKDVRRLEEFESKALTIDAHEKGYIQYIHSDGLFSIACENDLIVEILKTPGDFICNRIPLMKVYSEDAVDEDVRKGLKETFVWGEQKTQGQDIGFSAQLLVEVAARALSPGVNDPFTAQECINQLQAGLMELANREPPQRYRYDKQANLRILIEPVTFSSLGNTVFSELRHYVKRDPMTAKHLLKAMKVLRSNLNSEEDIEFIRDQAEALYIACKNVLTDERDLCELQTLQEALMG